MTPHSTPPNRRSRLTVSPYGWLRRWGFPAWPYPRVPEAPGAGEVALRAEGVSVTRAGRAVLAEVSLEVRSGETLALVGPNGAGKSTLLGVLAGDVAATAGEVTLAGRALGGWSARELAMRRSVLPQSHALSFPFTVADVVRMGRTPWAGTEFADEDDAAVAAALRDTDMSGFAGRPFPELSGGEQARAALARVLAQRTGVLLLDEPTAALDIRHQELVFAVTRRQAARGHAVVAVVHDLGLAAAYADRVAVLAAGRLVACGPPAEVLTGPLLTSVYEHEIDVLAHPSTGETLVVPRRPFSTVSPCGGSS